MLRLIIHLILIMQSSCIYIQIMLQLMFTLHCNTIFFENRVLIVLKILKFHLLLNILKSLLNLLFCCILCLKILNLVALLVYQQNFISEPLTLK